MRLLKQSTAVTIKAGPAVDSTDAVSHETALTISQSDVILFKNFGAGAQKNDTNAATHDTAGHYGVPLNTTDTNTLGHLRVYINESGAIPFWEDFMVVPANVYDSFVLGTDFLEVDLSQIDGVDEHVEKFAASVNVIAYATVTNAGHTPTTTEFETGDITTAAADHWIGRVLIFGSGTLAQQATVITDYALASGRGHFTVSALTSAPANGVQFVIL